MQHKPLTSLAILTKKQLAVASLIATAAMEILTLILRFGLNMQYANETKNLSHLTFNIRIHHGISGLALLLITYFLIKSPPWRNLLLIIATGMILSDMIHHFLILWPITGSPQFYLFYPTN